MIKIHRITVIDIGSLPSRPSFVAASPPGSSSSHFDTIFRFVLYCSSELYSYSVNRVTLLKLIVILLR